MTFNWEISVGSLLAMFAVASGFASFYFGTRYDTKNLKDVVEAGMAKLDKNIETMNKVVMELALSTQRQDNFERSTNEQIRDLKADLRELKHGDGFIEQKR